MYPYPLSDIVLQANAEAVGVIGIIDCPFLQPTHNKQEFNGGHEYSWVHLHFVQLLTCVVFVRPLGI